MSLQGRLEDAHLLEVIRMLHSSGKEGKLTLQSQENLGFVLFKAGEILAAKAGNLQGEEAIYQMTLWDQGPFRFETEAVTQPRALKLSHPNLMIEASRRFSEWRMISKKIQSLDLIPEFVPQSNQETPQISLSTNEWVLLSKVDGHRTIKTISESSKFGIFETCKIFYGLISSGLLRVRAPSGSGAFATLSPPSAASKPSTPRPAPPAPTFGFGAPAAPTFGASSSKEPPAPAKPAPVQQPIKVVDMDAAIATLHRIGEKYLGSFASSIVDKSMRKAKVDSKDKDLARQSSALRRSVEYTQKASSTILGPELAGQMAKELQQKLDELFGP